jgi:hypothetical protein
MSLKTQIAADTTIYLNVNEFAEAVTFATALGEEAVSINMVIDRGAALDDDERGGALSAAALGYIGMDDVTGVEYGNVIAATNPDGTAETWTVQRIKLADLGMYEVILIKDLRPNG